MDTWKNSKEYREISEALKKYWLDEPDEEFVSVTMYFKHKDGRELTGTVMWTNPDMTFEHQMALHYKQRVENSGLKLGYVAEQMGVSRQTLWAKLNGKSRLTVEDQLRLTSIILKGEKENV